MNGKEIVTENEEETVRNQGRGDRERWRAERQEGVVVEYWWKRETDDERKQKQRRERIMRRVTERRQKEKNGGAEKTCQYIIPRHSSKPSEDKDKDMKKARRKKTGHRVSLH